MSLRLEILCSQAGSNLNDLCDPSFPPSLPPTLPSSPPSPPPSFSLFLPLTLHTHTPTVAVASHLLAITQDPGLHIQTSSWLCLVHVFLLGLQDSVDNTASRKPLLTELDLLVLSQLCPLYYNSLKLGHTKPPELAYPSLLALNVQ